MMDPGDSRRTLYGFYSDSQERAGGCIMYKQLTGGEVIRVTETSFDPHYIPHPLTRCQSGQSGILSPANAPPFA